MVFAVTLTWIPAPVKVETPPEVAAPEQSALLNTSTCVGEPVPVVPCTSGVESFDGDPGDVAVIVGAAGWRRVDREGPDQAVVASVPGRVLGSHFPVICPFGEWRTGGEVRRGKSDRVDLGGAEATAAVVDQDLVGRGVRRVGPVEGGRIVLI